MWMADLAQGSKCKRISVHSLIFFSLPFWKNKENPQKQQGFVLAGEPLKSLENKQKNAQRNNDFLEKKKARKPKTARKRRSGLCLSIRLSSLLSTPDTPAHSSTALGRQHTEVPELGWFWRRKLPQGGVGVKSVDAQFANTLKTHTPQIRGVSKIHPPNLGGES